jgi:hypothetical protein
MFAPEAESLSMPNKYERFAAAYLRLNGYFTVPNFIVHAADDPQRVSGGHVGNYTETDILGVRMPYSREVTGSLVVRNDPTLVTTADKKIDVVILEVKTGKHATPNSPWHSQKTVHQAIPYIVRFVGLHSEVDIPNVAEALAVKYSHEDELTRLRYIMMAEAPNEHYQARGVTYITFDDAIRFVVKIRGQCWLDANIGISSLHHQWDDLLVDLFGLANKANLSVEARVADIKTFLAADDQVL